MTNDEIIAAIQAASAAENYKLAYEICQRYSLTACLLCGSSFDIQMHKTRSPFCQSCAQQCSVTSYMDAWSVVNASETAPLTSQRLTALRQLRGVVAGDDGDD
jgi:hypothetical protein